MTDNRAASVDEPATVSIRGGMTAYVSVHLPAGLSSEEAQLQLGDLLRDNPEAYRSAPCVLSLSDPGAATADLSDWLQWCRDRQLVPFALRGNEAATESLARAHGLACLPASDRPRPVRPPQRRRRQVQVITRQVRSGQQIYAREGDLIVLAAVSAGAEVLADHDIHIHGELRGRALAGLQNDDNAIISCQSLAAELVAINGRYTLADAADNDGPTIIQCVDDQLVFSSSTAGRQPRNGAGTHDQP